MLFDLWPSSSGHWEAERLLLAHMGSNTVDPVDVKGRVIGGKEGDLTDFVGCWLTTKISVFATRGRTGGAGCGGA